MLAGSQSPHGNQSSESGLDPKALLFLKAGTDSKLSIHNTKKTLRCLLLILKAGKLH